MTTTTPTATATLYYIDKAPCWTTENFDLNAPITATGFIYLLADGTTQTVLGSTTCSTRFVRASELVINDYRLKRGLLVKGDEVMITHGRKLPIGSTHIVKDFAIYIPAGTYGHVETLYVLFEDGTRTNINNVQPINHIDETRRCRQFQGRFIAGGRL